jgi:hypothetical protein
MGGDGASGTIVRVYIPPGLAVVPDSSTEAVSHMTAQGEVSVWRTLTNLDFEANRSREAGLGGPYGSMALDVGPVAPDISGTGRMRLCGALSK